MATLKSALRFSQHPPPPPTPPTQQYPNLTSRFSAETLVIKSPPRAMKRLFSSNSPPSSPRHRSSSFAIYKAGHSATASESRINISSPRLEEMPARASFDDEGPGGGRRAAAAVRSHSRSRSRVTSGTAADKLAEAAHEVIAKLTLRRHGRQASTDSQDSVESLASPVAGRKSSESTRSHRRSRSSPSPVPTAVLEAASAQPPSRPPPPRPSTRPFKLTDLPPRSDSRNAIATHGAFSKPPSRRAPPPALPLSTTNAALPALAASRPRPKHVPALAAATGPRPQAPPTASIAPLRPVRPARPLHSCLIADGKVDDDLLSALVIKPPSAAAIQTRSRNELLVKLDIGGESTYTTSVATLARADGCGGRLADFVEGVLADAVRAGSAEEEIEEDAAAMHSKPLLDLPIPLPFLHVDEDGDGGSSISIPVSQSTASPCPSSPFPFAGYASSGDECDGSTDEDNKVDDPLSPIDPFVASSHRGTNLFLALPPTFKAPPPPLPVRTVKEVQQPRVEAQQAQVVPSPTLSTSGKHKSVYPDLGSVELPPSPPASLPSVPPLPPSTPSTALSAAQFAAQRALATRVKNPHFSAASTTSLSFSHDPSRSSSLSAYDDEDSSSSSAAFLQPFFSVLRNQSQQPLSPSSPITAAAFVALERQSLDYGLLPSDVEGYESEEDRSRSTVLGVPRGLSRKSLAAFTGLGEEDEQEVPKVPEVKAEAQQVEKSGTSSRRGTPSLTMSATTADDEEEELPEPVDTASTPSPPSPPVITLDDCTLHLFLDRTDAPLASVLSLPLPLTTSSSSSSDDAAPPRSALTTYSTILTFLRIGGLPPSLTLPTSPSIDELIDPVYLSLLRLSPAPLFSLVAGLRTLEAEARWLGMRELEVACQKEVEKVRKVVEMLGEPETTRKTTRTRERSKEEVFKGRERQGWI